ncbi:MAG: hypothetical protein L3J39_02725 [Verrucomicrobiales bacterium]|nr:hypothetical protein [Verrucomicrobiales bacterium]
MMISSYFLRIISGSITCCVCAVLTLGSGQAEVKGLSPDQIEEISEQLAAIRKVLTERSSSRNQNAADVFLAAAGSGKDALALYVKCYKEVNFDREGRKDADFRDWRDKQANRFRDDAFIEGLRLQLRYLGLSCKAAEAEELDEVFGNLMSYVDGLTQLKEMPGREAMQAINGTVFAKAYELDKQLAKNKSWETVPYNLAGIYEKSILPYLRKENPSQLMGAWDKRIDQQTRVVQFLEREKEKQLKGSRDDKVKIRNRQSKQSGVMRAHDKEFFIRETLPSLKWGKMVDNFKYINRAQAALGMLTFIKENIKDPKAETWMTQLTGLLADPGTGAEKASTPAVRSTAPAVSAPASRAKATPSGGSRSSKGSKVPAGFDS